MTGTWALIKDGLVINIIAWDGPDVSPMVFDDGVDAIEYNNDTVVSAGYSYVNGVFSAPEATKEEKEREEANRLSNNTGTKETLMSEASQKISVLQDAVDLDMATEEESTALPLWKKYRVLLSRIDANTSDEISWPIKP